MYKSLYFISLSKTSSSRMVTACLRGPELPATSRGEQLGAVAEEARGGGNKGRAGVRACPRVPPLGCKQRLLGHAWGTCPGDPFPGPWDPCVQRRVGGSRVLPARHWPGSPRPRAGFIAGGGAGGGQGAAAQLGGSRPNAAGDPKDRGDSGGLEREQRTRGRMERRGAPWHRDTNARTGGSRAETRTSERWGQRGQGGGDEAGGSLPRACLCTRSAERGARSSRC